MSTIRSSSRGGISRLRGGIFGISTAAVGSSIWVYAWVNLPQWFRADSIAYPVIGGIQIAFSGLVCPYLGYRFWARILKDIDRTSIGPMVLEGVHLKRNAGKTPWRPLLIVAIFFLTAMVVFHFVVQLVVFVAWWILAIIVFSLFAERDQQRSVHKFQPHPLPRSSAYEGYPPPPPPS